MYISEHDTHRHKNHTVAWHKQQYNNTTTQYIMVKWEHKGAGEGAGKGG